MLQEIIFEEPTPLVRRPRGKPRSEQVIQFARTLANGAPNRWALYEVMKKNASLSHMYTVRKELKESDHPIHMDIASRKQEDGTLKVFVKAHKI